MGALCSSEARPAQSRGPPFAAMSRCSSRAARPRGLGVRPRLAARACEETGLSVACSVLCAPDCEWHYSFFFLPVQDLTPSSCFFLLSYFFFIFPHKKKGGGMDGGKSDRQRKGWDWAVFSPPSDTRASVRGEFSAITLLSLS